MDVLENNIAAAFRERFHHEPLIIRAPGRINLIGEHTDYNDGFVMPAAIDKEVVFAVAPSTNGKSVVYSVKYDQQFEINLNNPAKTDEPRWANYLLGVIFKLQEQGHSIKPFNCVFGGNVPMGAGMSSSAAMETGFAYALNELNQLNIPKIKLITIAQWAEHNYAGVKCGIMDQFASVMGKAGHVILLDCRSLTHRYAPIDLKDYEIILCDTKVKHSLVDSEYNTRRQECETGVAILQQHYPQIKALRDVSPDMLEKHRNEFPGKVYNRCRYMVDEIGRVQEATKDLEKGDLVAFGKKMYETHYGLSKLFEVSCTELDFLADEAKKFEGVLGARMMGGGFGGCTINIVKKDLIDQFEAHQKAAYKKAFGIDMQTYRVSIREGTSIVSNADVAISH